jgi:serine/threonine protein kinase
MADQPPSRDGASPPAGHTASEYTGPGKGFRIGEYIIDRTLGHGSMGTVFLAHDGTGHEVALKIFQEGPGVSATMLERFRREAEAAKKLRRHPNIMKVYATGHEGPYHYIVMEPVHHSRTLDDLISGGPTDIPAVLRILIKIARALYFAHSHNIVHRDVKPSNIMINEFGEPLLTDFGVAAISDWPGCTITGALTGTPLYMSPEQARSERAGPASDIYSLGVVMFEALTGVLPYNAQSSSPVKNVLESVKNEMPPRPRSLRKEISPEIEAIVMKTLEKDPDDRYADADALAHDLERALDGRHVSAHLFTLRDRVVFFMRRHRKMAFTIASFLILLTAFYLHFQRQLHTSQFEFLLTTAHLRNAAQRESAPPGADGISPLSTSLAQQEWLMASRAINQGQHEAAIRHLESTIQLSWETADARTESRAEKELARILSIRGEIDEAMKLYRKVIANADAPTAEINQAQLEALILALLFDRRTDAMELLGGAAPQAGNIFRNAIRCLSGEVSADSYREQITYLPGRLQNDAHLALAVRLKMDGDTKSYRRELQYIIRTSSPASEWPGPFARFLYEEARK